MAGHEYIYLSTLRDARTDDAMVGVLCAGGLGKSEWNNLVGVIFAVGRVSLDMDEGE